MGLANTLIKVAIGMAVAKGVSTLVKGGSANSRTADARPSGVDDIMDGIGGRGAGSGKRYEPQNEGQGGGQGGGLGDLLGQLTGQQPAPRRNRTNAPSGGLEGMLGGSQTAGGGGLGDLLGQLTGGGNAGQSSQTSGGGLGDLLGQLTGGGTASRGAAQSGGGLGDLLGQLTGAGTTSRGAAQSGGGLGDLLGQLTGGGAGSGASGGGLGDLLGAVLGGTVGGAAGGAAGGALAGGQDQRQQDLAAALILRAMVAAIKADGQLDEAEKQKLMQHAEGASREEMAYIQAELERRTDVNDLAGQVPEGMEAQVYVMSLMAIDLDNQKEAQYLDSLAKALALEPREVNALHDQAGAQRLYN